MNSPWPASMRRIKFTGETVLECPQVVSCAPRQKRGDPNEPEMQGGPGTCERYRFGFNLCSGCRGSRSGKERGCTTRRRTSNTAWREKLKSRLPRGDTFARVRFRVPI